jgi:hypothetical protein
MIDAVLQRETERTVKIGLIGLPKQRVGSSNLLSRSNLILNWSDKVRKSHVMRKFTPTLHQPAVIDP